MSRATKYARIPYADLRDEAQRRHAQALRVVETLAPYADNGRSAPRGHDRRRGAAKAQDGWSGAFTRAP